MIFHVGRSFFVTFQHFLYFDLEVTLKLKTQGGIHPHLFLMTMTNWSGMDTLH